MISLALKRIFYYKVTSAITAISIALCLLIFLFLNSTLKNYSSRITNRADQPILVAGPRYSGIDLTLKALYFRNINTPTLKYSTTSFWRDQATVVPIFLKYRSKDYPVCGTTLDYFTVRTLSCSEGNFFSNLGECVIGNKIAKSLNLKVGDAIFSDPQNFFNPANSLPLKMKISGILNPQNEQDDNAIFVSLKTAWTIDGIGHSHAENVTNPDYSQPYLEITPETLETFHFHGNQEDYPLTALLLQATSPANQALILAQGNISEELTVLKPYEGIKGFLELIFHLDTLFSIALFLTLFAIALLFSLAFFLSLKLRQTEKILLHSLGAENNFFYRQITLEWLILSLFGIIFGIAVFLISTPFLNEFLNNIIRK